MTLQGNSVNIDYYLSLTNWANFGTLDKFYGTIAYFDGHQNNMTTASSATTTASANILLKSIHLPIYLSIVGS